MYKENLCPNVIPLACGHTQLLTSPEQHRGMSLPRQYVRSLLTISYLTCLVLVRDIPAMAKVHDEMAATTIGTMDADPEAGEHGGALGISQESLKIDKMKDAFSEEMHFSEMMWFLPFSAFYCRFVVLLFWFLWMWFQTFWPRTPCACSSFTPISFKWGTAFKKAEPWSESWRACESTSIPVWHFGSKRWDEKTNVVGESDHMSCNYSTPAILLSKLLASATLLSSVFLPPSLEKWLNTKRCNLRLV